MCNFFGFITVPSDRSKHYFNWEWRFVKKSSVYNDNCDSHRSIADHYNIKTNFINCYEYNPLTKQLTIDCIHGGDDQEEVELWLEKLDWKTIVKPLIIKPVVNPFELPTLEVSKHHIRLLKKWTVCITEHDHSFSGSSIADISKAIIKSVVGSYVAATVGSTIIDMVYDALTFDVSKPYFYNNVMDMACAYITSFYDIDYFSRFSPAVKLWESGFLASYDGTTGRLYSGKDMKIVYEAVL